MEQGSRLDLAIGMLGPDVTSKFGGGSAESGGDSYFMPAFGWVKKNGAMSYGVSLFAQGGMGTEYAAGSVLDPSRGQLAQRSELGVGRLLFPLAYVVSPTVSIGGSIDYVWAMMDLQMAMNSNQFMDMAGAPGGFGGIPGCATGNCYGKVAGTMMQAFNGSVGAGVMNPSGPLNWGYFDFSDGSDYTGKAKGAGFAGKIGFTYKASPTLTIGGAYHTKTALSDMDGNASVSFNANLDNNLLGGTWNPGVAGTSAGTYSAATIPVTGKISLVDFEWPETMGLGIAYQASDKLLFALDYKRINWADVMKNFNMTFTADAIQANPMAAGFAGTVLDATMYQNWDDQDVFIIGLSYKATDVLTLRVGANMANNPVPDKFMNPLFPAIEEDHYTFGFGYALNKAADINFSLQLAPEVTQTMGQGVTVDHSQTNWQLMYSKRF